MQLFFFTRGPMASKPDVKKSTEAADAVEGRTIPQCKPCSTNNKTTAAQVYCHDCKEFQCSECSDHHNAFAFMSGHNIVDWKLKDPEEKVVNMFGFDKCTEHGNPVTIYCEDHDVFCCSTCGFSRHKLCEKAKGIHEFSVDVNVVRDTLAACNKKAINCMHALNEIGLKEEREIIKKADLLKSEINKKSRQGYDIGHERYSNIGRCFEIVERRKHFRIIAHPG
ncbi:uncharacterized protein LOC128244933 isoform X1 [Mya arenaria]|uniref:uncharacterized protein LOC128244933 isoform X1 n=1 Tax=Mya arenaria TaxID=6604 RepID=UPI0022E98139|nr:uncharacterized protein LOC128244933 isoform X1 [Mya arenaria]